MAVRKLEDELGLTLFHRNERRVTLTDEGLVLLPHARQILQGVADAELAMHELHGLQQGEVRIGISNMLGSYYFPPILMAFRERYPGVRLSVVEAGTRAIQRMIMEGEIDIGVVVADAPPAELESRCFLRDQMMAIVPDDHVLAQRKAIRFDEFFDEELVLFKQGYFHREVIDRLCAEHGLQANIGFETNLLALIRQIVKQGFAITTLLPMVIRDDHSWWQCLLPSRCGWIFLLPGGVAVTCLWRIVPLWNFCSHTARIKKAQPRRTRYDVRYAGT